MSDLVDSELGHGLTRPFEVQPPPPAPGGVVNVPDDGPFPPPLNGDYDPPEPTPPVAYWALVAAAIVVVAALVWAVGSLLGSDTDVVSENPAPSLLDPLVPASPETPGDPVAGDESQLPSTTTSTTTSAADDNTAGNLDAEPAGSGDESADRPVLSISTTTTTAVESTTTAAESTTTTQATTTTEAPASTTTTTEAPTSSEAPPSTASTTSAPEPTSTEAPTTTSTTTEQTTTTEAPTTQPPAPSGNDSAVQQQVLDLTNQARTQNGCPALTINSQLNTAADNHSEDMAARGYFDHTSPEGEGPGTRVAEAGYSGRGWGENIAQGYGSAQAVVDGWMNSPGHRANILNCDFNELGVGYAEGSSRGNVPGIYWTQVFGIS